MAITENIPRVDVDNWPIPMQGMTVGNDGYLIAQFPWLDGSNGDKKGTADTFYHIDIVRDVTVNQSVTTVDVTSRRSGIYKEQMPVKNELSVTGEILYDVNEGAYVNLEQTFREGKLLKLGAFTSDGRGHWMYATITNFTRNEELENIVRISAEFTCARYIRHFDSFEDAGTDDHPAEPFATKTVAGNTSPAIAAD